MSAAQAGSRRSSGIAGILKRREFSVAVAVVVVVAVATAFSPSFSTGSDGFRNLLLTPFLLMLLAIAQAIVIVTKNIDLSVSATLGLTAYATGRIFSEWTGAPIWLVVLIGIALGAVLGAINGLLVSVAGVPSLVITLGTLYIYRGVDVAWAGANRINADDLPDGFTNIGTAAVLGIPYLILIAIVALIVVAYVLGFTRSGRQLYAIGSDDVAAKLYGLPVARRVFFAFVASGTLSGLAGVLYTARYATVSSSAGTGLELQAVAAAVIGGLAIAGGSGTALGAALGAVLLSTIDRALPTVGIQDFWQQAVVGALIIGAITLDRLLALRTARRLRSSHSSEISPPGIQPTTASSQEVAS